MKHSLFSAILFLIPLMTNSQTDNFHDAFVENFSDTTLTYFLYGSTGNKSDFK